MKDQDQLIALFNKYLSNQCSLDELQELMQYFNSTQSEVLEERILQEFESLTEQSGNQAALPPRVFEKIKTRISVVKADPVRRSLWTRWVAAACVLLIVGLSFYFYRPAEQFKEPLAIVQDIDPARNGAILTLANGQKIGVGDLKAGDIAQQSGVQISKTADGELVYTVLPSRENSADVVSYNTLTTSRGEQTQVRLPDGSVVFLNAASSLRFPTSFSNLKERRVEVSGEAYFEVAKDKAHPFIVSTAQQEVKVLGTLFNINSYAEEAETKTTLVEGSIRIAGINSNKSKIMVPGQQGVIKDGEILLSKADVEQALSWKNGDFVFTGEDLKAVMRQVSRWYNVEVEYQGNINSSGVVSTISRTKKLSEVLKALQANQGIHFKVSQGDANGRGRRVLVMP